MSTLKTMEIFKKKKQKQKQTNKQTNKQKQQQQHGKIAVPFPGKFGKRKTALKKHNARCDAFCCDVRFRAYHTR